MDMSAADRKAVTTHWPKAKIVFDHFHVVKLFNEKLSDLRRGLVPRGDRGDAQGGAQGDAVAVAEEPREPRRERGREKRRLEEAPALNKPLARAYSIKQDLRRFWEQPGQAVRDHIPGRLDPPGRGVGDQDAPADGQDTCGTP